MRTRKILLLMSAILCISLLFGCGNRGNQQQSTGEELNFTGYPMQTDETIRIWSNQITPHASYKDWTESPFHNYLNEATGVSAEWIFPAAGTDASQAFNLMLASDTLPDAVIYSLFAGAQRYIEEGVIRSLNDVLPQHAPAYWEFLNSDPYLLKSFQTDNGNFFGFGSFRDSSWGSVYIGPQVRKDWLDEQGLPIPETIDDWDNMLRVFKNEYNAFFGFESSNSFGRFNPGFGGAFGAYATIHTKLYADENGKVQLAQAQPEYKEYMTLLNRWYKDGLIDPDVVTLDNAGVRSKIMNNQYGATNSAMSQLNLFITDAQKVGNGAEWIGVPYPVMKKGDKVAAINGEDRFASVAAVITTSCPDYKVPVVARFFDYAFTDEGSLLWNFGKEGESYEMVEGKPVYTESVVNAPEGISDVLRKYIGTTGWGIGIQSTEMLRQKFGDTASAVDTWITGNEDKIINLPTGMTFTLEESEERSQLFSSIKTYTDETALKFFLGDESLDNFDVFLENLDKMGLQRLLEITQDAYDRFQSR